MPLSLRFHNTPLSIGKLDSGAEAPAAILAQPLTCFFRTHNEATLICPTELMPADIESESGFIALEFIGPFDFALTGILTQVAVPLAEAGISIIALSSFATDYVLIKAAQRDATVVALCKAAHSFV